MGTQSKLLVAMVLMVVLPLSVAVVTGVGLWQMGQRLGVVSEEYAEVRLLQGVEAAISSANVAVRGRDAEVHQDTNQYIHDAKENLVAFMAMQFESVADQNHQMLESKHAQALLSQLEGLADIQWNTTPLDERVAIVERLRTGLDELYSATDHGVRLAQSSALRTQQMTLWLVIVAALSSAAICIVLSIWSANGVNKRLRELHRRLSAQPALGAMSPPREIGGVVTQIEEMHSRMIQKMEDTNRELLRRERLAGIGLLAADVAHEINNPMNAMLGLSELALGTVESGPVDEAGRQELQESLRVVRREAWRCRSIVERLMAMVRSDREAHWFNTTRLLNETVQVARAARPDKAQCFIVHSNGVDHQAFAPPDDVRQIMLTLLINAADAVVENGHIEVDATHTDHEICLRVRDDGQGFTKAIESKLFAPFQSHRENGKGAGLGLSIAQALAEEMGAALRPFSEGPGKGSEFVLAIPNNESKP